MTSKKQQHADDDFERHVTAIQLAAEVESLKTALLIAADQLARLKAENAALRDACETMIAWDKAENTALPYDNDNGKAFRERIALCNSAFDKARAALAKVGGK